MNRQFRRKNHYLPQMYLKNFTDEQNQLHSYRLLVSHDQVHKWKRTSVEGFAYHDNLYTYHTEQGETDAMERWFHQEVEQPVEKALEKVVTDAQMTPNDWKNLIRFTMALDLRTPARMIQDMKRRNDTLPDFLNKSLPESFQEFQSLSNEEKANIAHKEKDDLFPFQIRVDQKRENPVLEVCITNGRSLWLGTIKSHLTQTLPKVINQRWTIVHPAQGLTWFTSDFPVIRLNYYRKGKYDFQGGWGNSGSELMLPLSPIHLLYTRVGSKKPWLRGTRLPFDLTQHIQKIIAEHAFCWFIAHKEDQEVSRLRPRVVNSQKFEAEKKFWEEWHSFNQQAEQSFWQE
ncbi:DUF4238 domain-containing protein [Tunicatimonas pelagia]|uniref:DUF4238 domain-containing protein n=1 Tax=Tunicatimonas pelagia TaxID=931531 RepID=UPI0026660544|nr:DUF4238 domain-containing protein [Tunicatimonas pelagia]WKN43137.1 DUF4238 domain-containing protein [Tunicatimonas pelagia]